MKEHVIEMLHKYEALLQARKDEYVKTRDDIAAFRITGIRMAYEQIIADLKLLIEKSKPWL